MEGVPTYPADGAAQLRLDHPLLIAELIREGEFTHLSPEELAALIAPFVMDKDKEITVSRFGWNRTRAPQEISQMLQKLTPLAQFMISRDSTSLRSCFGRQPRYSCGQNRRTGKSSQRTFLADEGDISMLILRTADHLRQLLSLEREEPQLAATARQAIELIVRLPVV